jgi:Tfp pilus assembly pilus retraction ATPase PilT
VLACEVLRVNNAVRNLIRERQLQQVYSVIQTGKSEGMVTMNESLRELVAQGRVDADLAMDRSPRPRELARMLGIGASRYRGAEELESEPVTTTAWS